MAANPVLGTETIDILPTQTSGGPAASRETVTVNQMTQNSIGGALAAYATSALTKTSDTALALIPGMSVTLLAGAVYDIEVYVTGSANASGGIKMAFGGTATATSFSADTWVYNATSTAAQGVITALSSNLVALTGAFTTAFVTGTIVVNAGGTLTLTGAQNASNASATTFAANCNMILTRIA